MYIVNCLQERYEYSAFGAPAMLTASFPPRSSSAFAWETLYGSYRWDPATSFYQVRYRYLHSDLGRWLSRDPVKEDDGANLYG
jgi:RHS repeat-associated protein